MIRVVVITYMLSLALVCQLARPQCLQAQIRTDRPPESRLISPSENWLTKKALREQLNSPVSISWTDAPLAERLRAFAAGKQFAVIIDRRVNPSAKVSLQLDNVTVEQLLLEIANDQGIGMCQLDDLIYFGPLKAAYELPVLWNELPRMTSQPAVPMTWAELSRPRDLLATIARDGGFQIDGIEQVRHDLLSEGSLPSLTPIQQVAIIAVGFELWPATSPTNRSKVSLRKLATSGRGQSEYVRSSLDPTRVTQLKRELKREFPELKLQVSRSKVRMAGSTKQLYAAKSFLIQRNQIPTPDAAARRFTLKTSATRLQILGAIAKQTGRELVFDPSLRGILDEQVDIECDQVTLQELVTQVLAGCKLKSETTPSAIQIKLP